MDKGVDSDFCKANCYRAVDVLGDEYIALEIPVTSFVAAGKRVVRLTARNVTFPLCLCVAQTRHSSNGMGIVVDSASNMITHMEASGAGASAGLLRWDIIAGIDDIAVTVIDDGYLIPRWNVITALDLTASRSLFTVFRSYSSAPVQPPRALPKQMSAQRL